MDGDVFWLGLPFVASWMDAAACLPAFARGGVLARCHQPLFWEGAFALICSALLCSTVMSCVFLPKVNITRQRFMSARNYTNPRAHHKSLVAPRTVLCFLGFLEDFPAPERD
jgi:hypothetical protein